jgi:hypothetical protein
MKPCCVLRNQVRYKVFLTTGLKALDVNITKN